MHHFKIILESWNRQVPVNKTISFVADYFCEEINFVTGMSFIISFYIILNAFLIDLITGEKGIVFLNICFITTGNRMISSGISSGIDDCQFSHPTTFQTSHFQGRCFCV